MGMEKSKPGWVILTYVLLILWLIFSIFPIYWLSATAFKGAEEAIQYPPSLFPRVWTISSFRELFFETSFGIRPFQNSAILGIGTALVSTTLAAMVGYGFSRFPFRGSRGLLISILLINMISAYAVIIPLYRIFILYGLFNTFYGLILVYSTFTAPFVTWLLKGYFDTIPRELEEAAELDGCNRLRVLWHIMLPLAAPGLAAGLIFGFIEGWNEFLIAVTLTSGMNIRPYTAGLYAFIGEYGLVQWHLVGAATFISVIPVLILFGIFQKYFIIGLAQGGMVEQ